MMNPITEMQAQITTAKVLQRDLRQAVQEKKESISKFYSAKEKAEQAVQNPPKMANTPEPLPIVHKPKQIIADAEKEQQLLKMAKEHYTSYADVAKFAEALGLRAGIVYLTLKHHNFIKQNETTQYRVLDSYYRNNGNLKAITLDTGLKVWIVSRTLEQLGIAPNWASYKERTETGNVGDWAEEEFKRLVPGALDMNMQYQMNNPGFDFMVNGKTVDVKSSNTRATRTSDQYYFRLRREKDDELPDFFCVFLIKDRNKEPGGDNYHILLIPKEVLPDIKKSISIVPKDRKANSTMYWDFEVEPVALAAVLDEI